MMKRRIVAFLQARTDSTRLPKKVLMPLLNKPMIIQELIRVQRSQMIDELVLLTSDEASDDELEKIVSESGFSTFRGSKDNVLERFYNCAKVLDLHSIDIIVRLTGDCPIHDATIIDELIKAFLESDFDYIANSVEPIYPDGLDAEVFTFDALKKAYNGAKKLSEIEHVTPYIRESGLFKTADLKKEVIHPEWRLTVDEPTDFTVIENIYNHFGTNEFTFDDIVSYIEKNPNIINLNSAINRNEGYAKSLEDDKLFSKEIFMKHRLFLQPLSEDVISEEYLAWMNDQEVLKFTESRWNKYKVDDLKSFVEKMNKSPNDFLFGIYIQETGKHIGNVKIGNVNKYHQFADLGIIIGVKDEWGKGYATEALTLAIDYAFNQLNLYKVTAGVYANNIGSIRALEKVGFTECGRHINHCLYEQDRIDVLTLEIINKRKQDHGKITRTI